MRSNSFNRAILFVTALAITALIAACGSSPEPTPAPVATATLIPTVTADAAATATATSEPTATAEPTKEAASDAAPTEPAAEAAEALPSEENLSLEGTVWFLNSYRDAEGQLVPVLEDAPITLVLRDLVVSGATECNNYEADYRVDGNAVSFVELQVTPLGAPRTECQEDNPITEQSSTYMSNLLAATTYSFDGPVLILDDGEATPLLVYIVESSTLPAAEEATPSATQVAEMEMAAAVFDRPWHLAEAIISGGTYTVEEPSAYLVTFHTDGKFEVNSPCDNGTGSWQVSGENGLLLTATAISHKATCLAGDLSDQFVSELLSTESYELVEETLVLNTKFASGKLIFD